MEIPKVINVDLASRALAYMGVFIALASFGLLNSYEFLSIPNKQYSPLNVSINTTDDGLQNIQAIAQNLPKNHKLQTENENVIQNSADIPKDNHKPDTKTDINNDKQMSALKEVSNTYKKTENDRKTNLQDSNTLTQKKIEKVKHTTQANNTSQQKNTKQTKTVNKTINENNKTNTSNNIGANTTSNNSATKINTEQLNKVKTFVSNSILDEIRSSLTYPKNAINRKIQGTVLIEFTVINGVIRSFKIAKSSGYPILDSAAKKLGNKLIGFNTQATAHELKINVPIQYSLIK